MARCADAGGARPPAILGNRNMSVISEYVARAYVDFLEPASRWQIYGTPRAGVLELIQQMGGSAEPLTSQEPFAGFTRLTGVVPRRGA
jgi:hypothetical protein